MDLNLLSPAIRDQVERILEFTPSSELYVIPTGDASPNPRRRVALKWLEAGLLGERPLRATVTRRTKE